MSIFVWILGYGTARPLSCYRMHMSLQVNHKVITGTYRKSLNS